MNNKGSAMVPVLIVMGILVAIGIVTGLFIMSSYNGLVNADLNVQESWGKVQTAYQRRIDLIPNLVATVKGSADFERSVQTQVAALRSGLGSAQTPEDINKIDGQVASTISFVFENYPQLRSTEGFLELQSQLEGTENRIKYERDGYNAAVKEYKAKTMRFPSNIFATIFGFSSDKHQIFEAEEGADEAPEVSFN